MPSDGLANLNCTPIRIITAMGIGITTTNRKLRLPPKMRRLLSNRTALSTGRRFRSNRCAARSRLSSGAPTPTQTPMRRAMGITSTKVSSNCWRKGLSIRRPASTPCSKGPARSSAFKLPGPPRFSPIGGRLNPLHAARLPSAADLRCSRLGSGESRPTRARSFPCLLPAEATRQPPASVCPPIRIR